MTTRTWEGRVFIATSIDGYIARRDADIEWLTSPPAGPRHASIESDTPALDWNRFFPTVDHLVMGRGTYEKVLTFDEWPYEDKAVVVLSTRMQASDSRITVVRNVDEAVVLLDRNDARQVYIDGGKVVQSFLRAGLVDEITVSRAPVILGDGLPLFGALDRDILLELIAAHATPDGMVHSTYRVYRD